VTNQQIFDTVAAHLLKQRKKSLKDGLCVCLIKDEFYHKRIEDNTPDIPKVLKALKDSGIGRMTRNKMDLLHSLQRVHDSYEPREWDARLRGCAAIYGLKVNF
jgi:hypothetical protein